MRYSKKTTKENYMSYLIDIYKGERNCIGLALKHHVSTTTIRALKMAKYVDDEGFSIMANLPTIQDANNIMKLRKELERKTYQLAMGNAKRNQLKLPLEPIKSKTAAKIKNKIKTREVSILWGLIKITL